MTDIDDTATIEIADWSKLPEEPLVSVYMLTYNHQKFIAEAIEGVIIQRCDFPIELIVGEDCSTDETKEIVLDYQKRYPTLIRVLTAQRNVGAHANAARCQAATKGKFVAICEGDDYWHHPRKLQMQIDLMSANPDMSFCHTDFDRKTRFRTRRSKHKNYPSPWLAKGHAYIALLHEWSVISATSMFRRDVMLTFKGTEFYNPSWPFGDRNRLLFASLQGFVGYIDESTTTFRKVQDSACNGSNSSNLKMQIAAEQCVSLFLSRHPVDPAVERDIRAQLKVEIYRAAFYAERLDLMQSSQEWLKSNGFSPSEVIYRARVTAIRLKLPIKVIKIKKHFIDLHLSAIPR